MRRDLMAFLLAPLCAPAAIAALRYSTGMYLLQTEAVAFVALAYIGALVAVPFYRLFRSKRLPYFLSLASAGFLAGGVVYALGVLGLLSVFTGSLRELAHSFIEFFIWRQCAAVGALGLLAAFAFWLVASKNLALAESQ